MDSLLKDIVDEVHRNTASGIHPTVLALVHGFLAYLREPRYQNPLSLGELAELFHSFYSDLDSLVVNIFTQLNTNKRLLLLHLDVFARNPQAFDYLMAIANYSSSSIKLVRRSDPSALAQLRIFAFYKAVTILDTLEKAQYDLFSAGNPGDSTLYEKIFRFEERDIGVQRLLGERIHVLRQLNLPFSCFCDTTDAEEKARLDEFFLTLDLDGNPAIAKVHASLRLMGQVRTPAAKLKHIVRIQKAVMLLLASFYDNDTAKVNNDILLPALIYILVYNSHSGDTAATDDAGGDANDLYLNFTFVKNFVNWIDPYRVESGFTLGTSLLHYNPTDHRRRKVSSLYELLNLSEAEKTDTAPEADTENPNTFGIPEIADDLHLISYLQAHFLNHGELQFYLTNFEAILYFLQNTPVGQLVPEEFTIPEALRESPHVTLKVVEIMADEQKARELEEEANEPITKPDMDRAEMDKAEMDRLAHDELDSARPRSSSLFNTISSAVSHVSRSRSNSALKTPTKEKEPDFEASLYTLPLASSDRVDNYGLGRVRNILGRFSLVSSMQVRPIEESLPAESEEGRGKRSLALFDRITPNHSRTRSASLETRDSNPTNTTTAGNTAGNGITGTLSTLSSGNNSSVKTVNAGGANLAVVAIMSQSGPDPSSSAANSAAAAATANFNFGMSHSGVNRRATLTKLSNGVSEFMTKLTATTPGLVPAPGAPLYYDDSPFEDKRPEFGKRSASLQTMDRWFSNIPEGNQQANIASQFTRVDSNNDGSVFSASFGELTRFQHMDFESLTINDLKTLKGYYDQLCLEVMATKTGSKTSNEFLPDDKDSGL